jgi:rubredoxin
MSNPYRCPNCKTNRSRFNLIEQISHAVKKDPQTGDIVQEYAATNLEPFHIPYNGPEYKIQCAVCGLIEDERMFIKFGEQPL